VVLAGRYNISLDQGATFERLITVRDANEDLFDFSNYTARMQIRRDLDDSTVITELTTENGYIILGGAAGTINLYMPPTITEDLITRDCVYDLEIIDPVGKVYRLLKGQIRIDKEVTR
jgi:hypothetical protein